MSLQALLSRLVRGPARTEALAAELAVSAAHLQEDVAKLRLAGVDLIERDGEIRLAHELQLLDADVIVTALPSELRAQVAALQLRFETDSTQSDALAATTPTQGVAIWLAERQTAGQGRRGRAWVSPLAANLMMSLSRRFQGGFTALSGLSLVVGVAVAEALQAMGYDRVGLKWPNDLVAEAGKLGGILVQLRGDARGPCEAIIGLGLNIKMPRSAGLDIDQSWCDLAQLDDGEPPSRNLVAAAVLTHLLPALDQFDRVGFAPFAARWQALDALAGKPVRVLDGASEHEGLALGVSDVGALRVQLVQGERQFHGGEVSLRPLGPRAAHRTEGRTGSA